MATLPTVGGSSGIWGTQLNTYLENTAAGVLNVLDYGAVGDSSTNNTTAIQAAIDAATALTVGGQDYAGIVYFPPGVYNTGQLTLKSDVRLIGAMSAPGPGYRPSAVRLFPTGIADDNYMFVQSGNVRNSAIEGIASYGGGSSSKTGFANLTDCTDCTFASLHIDNYGLEAFILGGSNNRVTDMYARGLLNTAYIASERGAFTLSGSDHQISHSELTGPGNATISSASLYCVAARFSMSETVVSECVFQVGDVGLSITGGSRNRYVGCRWDSNAAHGMVVGGGTYMTFAGCTWSRNSYATTNTYDHINVPSGGGSLATFTAPLFTSNGKTIRYWINDAKSSATFYNTYLMPHGEAAGTANYTVVSSPVRLDTMLTNPHWFPLYTSANYYFCNSPGSASTNASLGNQTLRVSPWIVTKTVSITRIGFEFTVAGEANSLFRVGVYADNGSGVPSGAALIDTTISTGSGNAGTVATGGTPGCYEATVSVTLQPGVYWVGGAVQGAATTQPTIRTTTGASFLFPVPSTAIPSTNAAFGGYQMAAGSGALPTWSGTSGGGSGVARVFFKVA